MAKHLGIFSKKNIEKIFAGQKTVDGRFSKIKISPFCDVSVGDVVYIKEPGEGVVGQFLVSKVIYFDHPDRADLAKIKKEYTTLMDLDERFWVRLEKVNYVSLIFIKSVTKFLVPPIFDKKDSRGWVKLD